jgi:GNAT superfamily N-acetyltransferase
LAAERSIAEAAPRDREAVIELLAAQLAEHAIDTPRDRIAAAVDGMIGDARRGFLLVAIERGAIVGVAYVSYVWSLEHGGRSAWLEELYVAPARREHGVGGRLLSAVLERAAADGCAAVDLEVDARHERAARLYSRHGFQPLPRARWVRGL